jgi:plasmid stabilization system protein ParE
MFTIVWQPNAEITFEEEMDFILKKWNYNEVQNFKDLTYKYLSQLALNPRLGNFKAEFKIFSFVISKQTTLYYDFDENSKIIDLHFFWNNLKNPNDLKKLL